MGAIPKSNTSLLMAMLLVAAFFETREKPLL